jgi:hypothetical protein
MVLMPTTIGDWRRRCKLEYARFSPRWTLTTMAIPHMMNEQQGFYKKSGANLDDPKMKARMDAARAKVDVNHDGSISMAEFEGLQLPLMLKAVHKRQASRKGLEQHSLAAEEQKGDKKTEERVEQRAEKKVEVQVQKSETNKPKLKIADAALGAGRNRSIREAAVVNAKGQVDWSPFMIICWTRSPPLVISHQIGQRFGSTTSRAALMRDPVPL